jgi:hypothetical protein
MTPEETRAQLRAQLQASGGDRNPLTSFFEADPAGWLPQFYGDYRDLGVAANAQENMTIRTDWAPYIWTHVVHTIVGNIGDPQTSGLYNDGQYLITLTDERRNFVSTPLPANMLFGPVGEGPYPDLPFPVFFPADHTVRVGLTNIYNRVLTPVSETFRVYFALKGLAYWGSLKPPEELLEYSKGFAQR